LVAVCTSATNRAEGASSVMSQAAPTFCIHVPILETTEAIQSQRNQAKSSGVQVLLRGEAVEFKLLF
jgi:hypothetical protein